MSLLLVPLEQKHLEDAARLVAARYRALRQEELLLPAHYEDVDAFYPLLAKLTAAAPGMVALRGGHLVGFLVAWRTPSLRGQRTIYSPEWANGADPANVQRIYQALYTAMAAHWVADGYFDHYLTLLGHDRDGIESWQWLGFGYHVTDALRHLDPPSGAATDCQIRRATPADLDVAADLHAQLQRYLTTSPIFLVPDQVDDRAEMEAWLQDPARALWLAYQGGRPAAYLRLEPASEDACTIIRDPGTTSITGAFTVADARGDGIATALLDRALAWAREEGYVRCAVDFEAMNVLGARFWFRHFRPICYSLYRHVNEHIIQDQ